MKIFCLLLLLCRDPGCPRGGRADPDSAFGSAAEVARRICQQGAELGEEKRGRLRGSRWVAVFRGEFRLLSLGRFWGDEAPKVSRSRKPELADPIPAIVDFQKQLKARGIDLLVVPVPPKAAIYPEKILPGFDVGSDDAAPGSASFL